MRSAVSTFVVKLSVTIILMASVPLFTDAGHALAQDNRLSAFTTDGCSMMLDGLPGDLPQWRYCCVAHDRDYWLGGSEEQRAASDLQLKHCISEVAAPALGSFVYSNVRWGGSPYWITPYRWGYGWPYQDITTGGPRGYKALTETEQRQADLLIPDADAVLSHEYL